MATLQSTAVVSQIQFSSRRSATKSLISLPKIQNPGSAQISIPKSLLMSTTSTKNTTTTSTTAFPDISINHVDDRTAEMLSKMYAVMEAVADRVEMHRNIGAQRDNWNSLLLTSVNSITLAATAMSGIASAAPAGSSAVALRLGAVALYVAATGLLAAINKIQPSQLAEEQRNAARLFEQLRGEIRTKLSLGGVTAFDVSEAMERVLALDKAYPLPLLGAMLEKFPEKVEPAVWWPTMKRQQRKKQQPGGATANGWSSKLEEELREICEVIERRDVDEYLRLSEKALKLNKFLAISGPVLTGFAAVGTALSGHLGAVPAVVGVLGGALASVVNAVEHGGQVGMVFEMYRCNAGFFRLVKETIESNLKERDVQRRENGQVLEMKVALLLGRSLSELKNLADKSRSRSEANNVDFGSDHSEEFASKLF